MKSRIPTSVYLLAVALLLFTVPLHAQTTIHVDDDALDDPGPGDPLVSDPLEDGSLAHPYDAIQEAIDAAVNGDTVLVADGVYTGDGNRDIDFNNKAITVASANGPSRCIIDGQGSWTNLHHGFIFNGTEGPDSVLQGLTISNFYSEFEGAGIYISASPTIVGNMIIANNGGDSGGGIRIDEGSPQIIGNVFTENMSEHASAIWVGGNGSPLIFNNLVAGNYTIDPFSNLSGAIGCFDSSDPQIIGCTIADNLAGMGYVSGIFGDTFSTVTVRDSIVWGNMDTQIDIQYGSVTHSCVEGGYSGTGNIDLDPLFVSGPDVPFYLSQIAAGQGADSPCLDAGSDLAVNICAPLPTGDTCLSGASTRTDLFLDTGQADMGYHAPAQATLSVSFGCVPDSGTLPFQTTIYVEFENLFQGITRRMAGKINVSLAGGQTYPSWRAGYTNVAAGDFFLTSWVQNIPALGSLVGENVFTLVVEDVTPAPYNQPPYPPPGDSDSASCTITGVAP